MESLGSKDLGDLCKRIVIKQLRGQMRLEADLVAFGASASAAGHRKNDASLKSQACANMTCHVDDMEEIFFFMP